MKEKEVVLKVRVYKSAGRYFLKIPAELEPYLENKREIMIKIVVEE